MNVQMEPCALHVLLAIQGLIVQAVLQDIMEVEAYVFLAQMYPLIATNAAQEAIALNAQQGTLELSVSHAR